MNVRYGTDIETLSRTCLQGLPESEDPSHDALIALALAYRAAKRLEEKGADLELGGRPLIIPSIERAYREVMHVRKSLNVDWLKVDLISKFGRLVNGKSKVQDTPGG
jgi:hypothetical protein